MASLIYILRQIWVLLLLAIVDILPISLGRARYLTRVSPLEHMVKPLILVQEYFLLPSAPYLVLSADDSPLPVRISPNGCVCVFSKVLAVVSYWYSGL